MALSSSWAGTTSARARSLTSMRCASNRDWACCVWPAHACLHQRRKKHFQHMVIFLWKVSNLRNHEGVIT